MNIKMTQDLQHSTNIWSLKELLSLCCVRALGLGLAGHACDESTLELPDTLLGRLCSLGPLCFFFGGCLGYDCLGLCSLGGGLGGSSSLAHDQRNGDGVVNAPAAAPQTNARNLAKNQNVASTLEHLQCTMLCEAPQRSSTRYRQANGWMAAWQPLPALPRMNDLGANRFGIIMELVGRGMC